MDKLTFLFLRNKISREQATDLINGPQHFIDQYLSINPPPDFTSPPSLVRYRTAVCKMCKDRMSIPEYVYNQIGRSAICFMCTESIRVNANIRWFNTNLRTCDQTVYEVVNVVINNVIDLVINEVDFLLAEID